MNKMVIATLLSLLSIPAAASQAPSARTNPPISFKRIDPAPAPVSAIPVGQVGIEFHHAKLADVIDAYYRLSDPSPYVVCPAATGNVGRVSVRAPINMTKRVLSTLLKVNGLYLRKENGIDVICDAKQSANNTVEVGGSRVVNASISRSASVPAIAPTSIEPYGPPEGMIPMGNPLTPPKHKIAPLALLDAPSGTSDPLAPVAVPAVATVQLSRMVYRVRYRSAEELLPLLQSLDLGKFSVVGQGTGRQDGSASSTLGGKAGDLVLWQGAKDDRKDVEDILAKLDQPSAQAYVEIAAVAVADVQSSQSSLALVGHLLGLDAAIGSPGGGLSVKVGGIGINFDSLESSRQLRVVKRWSGYVSSGRDIETLNGGTVPVVSEITESSTGRVTQGVTYQPTGLSMHVSPTVLDDVVRLNVNLRDQSVAGGTGTTPAFETRSLTGDMQLCFGCVSMISSLDDQTTDSGKSKFLGILPVSKGRLNQRTKLIYIAYVRAKPEKAKVS